MTETWARVKGRMILIREGFGQDGHTGRVSFSLSLFSFSSIFLSAYFHRSPSPDSLQTLQNIFFSKDTLVGSKTEATCSSVSLVPDPVNRGHGSSEGVTE